MIARFQKTGVSAGIVKCSYELRIPTASRRRRRRARRRRRRLGGGEVAALVEEPHDRLGEHGGGGAGRDEQEGDLPQAGRDGAPEAVVVAAGGEPRERREQHRRDRDREHPLREHVDPEGGVDRRGRQRRVDQARGEQRVDHEVDVDQPEPERHRQHQLEDAADGRVAPVDHELQAPVAAGEPRERQQHLDHGPGEDREGVDLELAGRAAHVRDADHEPGDDREVPEDGRQRRDREVLVGVEDPDDDPGDAEQRDDREEDPRERHGEALVAARQAERAHDPGRDHDEEGRQAAEPEQQQPEEARGDAPGPLAVALLEQVGEDGDERRGERRVGDERPHEVRHLEGDGERVDRAGDAEVVLGDDLADEAEDAREARRGGEDRGRERQAAAPVAVGALLGGGLVGRGHGASIGARSAGRQGAAAGTGARRRRRAAGASGSRVGCARRSRRYPGAVRDPNDRDPKALGRARRVRGSCSRARLAPGGPAAVGAVGAARVRTGGVGAGGPGGSAVVGAAASAGTQRRGRKRLLGRRSQAAQPAARRRPAQREPGKVRAGAARTGQAAHPAGPAVVGTVEAGRVRARGSRNGQARTPAARRRGRSGNSERCGQATPGTARRHSRRPAVAGAAGTRKGAGKRLLERPAAFAGPGRPDRAQFLGALGGAEGHAWGSADASEILLARRARARASRSARGRTALLRRSPREQGFARAGSPWLAARSGAVADSARNRHRRVRLFLRPCRSPGWVGYGLGRGVLRGPVRKGGRTRACGPAAGRARRRGASRSAALALARRIVYRSGMTRATQPLLPVALDGCALELLLLPR